MVNQKLIRLILLVLFFSPSVYAFDLSCTTNEKSIFEQIQKLNCDVRAIGQQINDEKFVVPKRIYHFGKEQYLMENVAHRNVPQKAWDEFIMSDKTRFSLKSNRRGLYGTGGIDSNNFGDFGGYNWLMEIHIKDECRQPDQVVTFFGLPSSKRFIKWFEGLKSSDKTFSTLEEFNQKCWTSEYFGSPKYNDITGGFRGDSDCEKFVNFYLESSKAKIVQDHIIKKSFYIRDRNCIETILGSPKEIIEIAAKNEFLWLRPCDENAGARSFSEIVIQALIKYEEEVPDEVIKQLIANFKLAQLSDIDLDAYLVCKKSKRLAEFRQRRAFCAYDDQQLKHLTPKPFPVPPRAPIEIR